MSECLCDFFVMSKFARVAIGVSNHFPLMIGLDSEAMYQSIRTFCTLTVPELPPRLQDLIDWDPEGFWALQRYIDEPPGEDMGVIYAEVFPNGKMYVGQHCHGKQGRPYSKSRMLNHNGSTACQNAYTKYGTENVRVFIIDRCRAGVRFDTDPSPDDSNRRERFFISEEGLDTLVGRGGYNLQVGGYSGPHHPLTIEAMKASAARPEVKERARAAQKKAWSVKGRRERQSAIMKRKFETNPALRNVYSKASKAVHARPGQRQKMSVAIQDAFTRQGRTFIDARNAKIRATHSRPEVRAKMSAISKAANARPGVKERRLASLKATNAQPEVKERRSVAAKATMARSEVKEKHSASLKAAHARPEVRDKRIASLKITYGRPEMRAKMSAISKAANARPEVRERRLASLKATNARPEVKAARSAISKAVLARPEVQSKRSASLKAAHARSGVKEKHSAAVKAGQALRVTMTMLPRIRRAFEAFYEEEKHLDVPYNWEWADIDFETVKLGKTINGIRSIFTFVKNSPELTVWLKEREFKLHTRDPVKNEQKWAELEAMHQT
tara:strand:- start:6395 stop:8065 length:1671 start_codon:yes stop_codon:yes gene_type:complete